MKVNRLGLNPHIDHEWVALAGFKIFLRNLPKAVGSVDPRVYFRDKKVLDVGCGTGTDMTRFQRLGAKVQGLDIHPTRPDIIFGRASSLPFPDASFDIVFSKFLMDLLPLVEIKAYAREAFRALVPGGKFIYFGLMIEADANFLLTTARQAGFDRTYADEILTTFVMNKPKN